MATSTSGVRTGEAVEPWARHLLHHRLEELLDASAVLSRNLDDRLEPEAEELQGASLAPPVVGLVDGHDHRHIRAAQGRGNLAVAGHQAFAAVHHEDDEIRIAHGALAAFDHELVKGIVARAEEPAGIGQEKRMASPDHRPGLCIARRPGHRRDDGATARGDPIEQRGLAHVRPSDEHDRSGGVRHSGD